MTNMKEIQEIKLENTFIKIVKFKFQVMLFERYSTSEHQRIITGEEPRSSKADLNSFFLSAGT